MTELHTIKEKWIEGINTSFTESKKEDGKRDLYLTTTIVPYNKTSRNGVRYNKESIQKTYKNLEGKTLNHNHVTSGPNVLPRGKWVETWLEDDGMHGRAKVFDTDYNKDYIEWLKADDSPRVSLQVTGAAKQIKEAATGNYYREAYIKEWLESSTVNVPGFDDAKGNFEMAITECFGNCSLEESIKPGKYHTKGGETITVISVGDGKAVISGNDSKNKTIDLDALKAIIKEDVDVESLQEAAMKDIQNYINDLSKKGESEKDIIKAVIKKFHLSKNEAGELMDETVSEDVPKDESFFGELSKVREVLTKI